MAAGEREVRLPDGRRLAYAEYGDPNGTPVLYFHGFPNSRLNAAPGDDAARRRRVRLIAFDRPGFGRSDFQRRRTIRGWVDDIVAAADQLGIDRFAVVALSGGGPYAVACAERIPHRITGVALVSALAPFDSADAVRGFPFFTRLVLRLWRVLPWLTRPGIWLIGRSARREPERLLERARLIARGTRLVPSADEMILSRPEIRAAFARDVAESFRQGSRAASQEFALYLKRWHVAEDSIAVQVHVWQGEADTVVPPSMGRYHANVIPGCRATFLPGEGHLLIVNHWEEILAALTATR